MSSVDDVTAKINEIQFNSTIEQCINKIIANERFTEHKTSVKAITTHGGNYLGDLFEVDVKGKTDNGEKETNLFVKKIRELQNTSILCSKEVHQREIIAYEEILPLYEQLEIEANIPEQERFKRVKFYSSTDEAIIFENLAKKGYKTLNRMDVITAEYASLVLEQLAKFHALSFVLKQKRSKYFEDTIKTYQHLFNHNEAWAAFFTNEIRLACSLLDDEPKRKLEAATKIMVESLPTYKHNSSMALCHGDYRINNILHKEENGKIIDVRPIDFQIMYNGHPLNDFMYLIFPASDKQFRKDRLQDMKEHYFASLTSYLKYFDIDIEDVYPRKSFEEDFKERQFYGLMVTLLMFPILFRSDMEDDDHSKPFTFQLDPKANDRIRDIVDDFIEWGYL